MPTDATLFLTPFFGVLFLQLCLYHILNIKSDIKRILIGGAFIIAFSMCPIPMQFYLHIRAQDLVNDDHVGKTFLLGTISGFITSAAGLYWWMKIHLPSKESSNLSDPHS